MQSFYRPTDKLSAIKPKSRITGARRLAYCAVACALLICLQLAFCYVYGIEAVTVFFVCFCLVFGVRCGILTAVSFSILRCLIWGFYPNVVILYLIYYPLVAIIFGLLGKAPQKAIDKYGIIISTAINILLCAIAALCMSAALSGYIKASVLLKPVLNAMLWATFSVCVTALVTFDALLIIFKVRKIKTGLCIRTALTTCAAAICTIFFTLLDDVLSPLITGMSASGALAYFYASFAAMLPQVICTVISVAMLYVPLTNILKKIADGN